MPKANTAYSTATSFSGYKEIADGKAASVNPKTI